MAMQSARIITAPPPMSATFVMDTDEHGTSVRLVEPWWPARLWITGAVLEDAAAGTVRGLTLVDERLEVGQDSLHRWATIRFDLANATATYREVRPADRSLWQRDVYEFDCIACARDVD